MDTAQNRLKGEKSPYLRQHAENPVDWHPWSEEAIERAKKEDKPMLISIGYSACHWCHVMEKESFEDPETARIMNENFINIKIDREERPDLDSLYMKAIQAMTGQGGWPLTVFATPEGVPFYGGTYFPPEDSYGMPSFKKILLSVSTAYEKEKKDIESIKKDLERILKAEAATLEIANDISDNAYEIAMSLFDPVNGGFGAGVKFPHAMFLEFLLKYHKRTGVENVYSMVKKSLFAMASGGVYDHIGGGFHRYAVDEGWEVPHFEKMLYDNALLAGVYSIASGYPSAGSFKDVATETLDYLLRDMRDKDGGFYASQDADVDGVEGGYYLWDYDEITRHLGEDSKEFIEYFSITREGNYGGMNTLRIKGIGGICPENIKRLKRTLLKIRQERKAPEIDRKIITGWNGLAISALVSAGVSASEPGLIDAARRCARFLLSSVIDERGRVLRYWLDGRSEIKGNLEDYALLGNGFLSLYEATKEKEWLDRAQALTRSMVEIFRGGDGLFYDTGNDQERLFVRERDLSDSDLPSGNSAAAKLLLWVSRITGDKEYREASIGILRSAAGMKTEPLFYGNFLCVLESLLEEGGPG